MGVLPEVNKIEESKNKEYSLKSTYYEKEI